MATNLDLDPNLVERALALSGAPTKKAAVTAALKEFISRDNSIAAFAHADLTATRESLPVVSPNPEHWTPNIEILDNEDQLTLRPHDLGRHVLFYNRNNLRREVSTMPTTEWPGICNPHIRFVYGWLILGTQSVNGSVGKDDGVNV